MNDTTRQTYDADDAVHQPGDILKVTAKLAARALQEHPGDGEQAKKWLQETFDTVDLGDDREKIVRLTMLLVEAKVNGAAATAQREKAEKAEKAYSQLESAHRATETRLAAAEAAREELRTILLAMVKEVGPLGARHGTTDDPQA